MALDAVKNFAKVTVSIGYDDVATSIVLTGGDGAKLPAPATDGQFNLVWWNSTEYLDPSDDPKKEIVRCTVRSTDTLTVTRAQEDTSASTKNDAGDTYKMILSPTAKMIMDIAPLASPTFTGTVTIPTPFTLGAVSVLPTGTELNYVDGVTSAIQTQLDAKASLASPTFTTQITTPIIALTGGQIAFPATAAPSANANTLDDYEEGTWTPGISFAGGTTGITYTSQAGTYTKVGNLVTINAYLVLNNKGSSVGNAAITGLPFTLVNNDGYRAPVALVMGVVTFANQFMGYAVPNATIIWLQETTEAGALTNLADTDFANTSNIAVNCTYRIA